MTNDEVMEGWKESIMAEPQNNLSSALRSVEEKMKEAYQKRSKEFKAKEPRLVAVSKTKPKEMIIEIYECGQCHFGENYVQELVDKANDPKILEKCHDIQWHFIGHLQRNKINKLITAAHHLYCVETIDSEKLASSLNDAWEKTSIERRLKVMIQVNTSSEESKSGIEPASAVQLVKYILDKCNRLKFLGLMTIGSFDHDLSQGPNPDFQKLIDCRKEVCETLSLDLEDVELSMGMSHDFEHAVEMGSTNVRVGSIIFGQRVYPNKTLN